MQNNFFIVLAFLLIQQVLFGMSNDAQLGFNILKTEIMNHYAVTKLELLNNFAKQNKTNYQPSKDLIQQIALKTKEQPDYISQSLVNEVNSNALKDIDLFCSEIKKYGEMTIDNVTTEFIENLVLFFKNNTAMLSKKYISINFTPCLNVLKSKVDVKNTNLRNIIESLHHDGKRSNKKNYLFKVYGFACFVGICVLFLFYRLLSQKLCS